MLIKTLLNKAERFKSFVYGANSTPFRPVIPWESGHLYEGVATHRNNW